MSEITIKINKTTFIVVGALLAGLVGGYFLGNVGDGNVKTNKVNLPVVQQPTGDNSSAPQISLGDDENVRGAKNPKVTLVEYSDFQCPFCQSFHPTMQQVLQAYPDDVAWVYRHFPLSFHVNAQVSAEASECAAEQGKFWDLADKMFEVAQSDGTGLASADLKGYAKQLGLNTSKFNDCLDSGKYADKVSASYSSGVVAGVNGTPGTILVDKNGGTKLISGAVPFATLKAAIDAAL